MSQTVRTAMIMAAGLGTRMRPLTDKTPKPLIPIHGRSLLDRCLDRLTAAGVERVVINLHYLGEQIRAHLDGYTGAEILFSDENEELLETGGGVRKAAALLGSDPVFVLNSDSIWLEGEEPALDAMARTWAPGRMESLLLLSPMTDCSGFDGRGDFHLHPDGRITRRGEAPHADFAFMGVQITKPDLFKDGPEGPFSTNLIWNKALEQGRLYGLAHTGFWMHVGDPGGLARAEDILSRRGED